MGSRFHPDYLVVAAVLVLVIGSFTGLAAAHGEHDTDKSPVLTSSSAEDVENGVEVGSNIEASNPTRYVVIVDGDVVESGTTNKTTVWNPERVTHTFTEKGNYTVTFRAWYVDGGGATQTSYRITESAFNSSDGFNNAGYETMKLSMATMQECKQKGDGYLISLFGMKFVKTEGDVTDEECQILFGDISGQKTDFTDRKTTVIKSSRCEDVAAEGRWVDFGTPGLEPGDCKTVFQ